MPVANPDIVTDALPGGATLVAEPIAGVRSLAMTVLLPAGLIHEPEDRQGLAEIVAELVCRGAGGRSAREHSDALDRLGVHRSTAAAARHLQLAATMVGDKLDQALPLLVDMIRRPNLDDTAFGPSRDLALQSLAALEDDPQQRVMVNLNRRHYPRPFDRVPTGVREILEAATNDDARALWQRQFVPGGAILAFAGDVDVTHLRQRLGELLEGWSGDITEPSEADPAPRGYGHESDDTAQTHVAVAYDAVPEPDDASMLQRAAVAVLSGGMSGRLFTEIREKRGLCYGVYARYAGARDRGAVKAYAGTTTPRAQETLDVLLAELRRLSDGVAEDEFDRAKVGMKSRLVMQSESTAARASALAADQYNLGRPRSLDELAAQVDAVTLDDLNAFVASRRPEDFTVTTVGEQPLTLQRA